MLNMGIKKKQGSIVDALKDEILSGNIPSGTEMTQNELAESLGVSRMPVREALIILEYQGLIERLPNNHVRVAELSDDYFKELFELCFEFEEKILKAGFTPCIELQSRFENCRMDEMMIHNQICQKFSNSLLRKTLNTIFEIYVDFAIKCSEYDSERGTELLKSAVNEKSVRRRTLLKQYFDELERVISNERRSRC